MDSIGERLEHARRRRSLTQEELARAAGVQVVTVSRIENNRQKSEPRLSTIRKLAEALGVEAEWLLFGDTDLKAAA
jgi:transcriptional regulator with XRE-family HTH domain